MYHQLTLEQRSQIFALLQNKLSKKRIAEIVGCSLSTIYREIKRNSTEKGHYLWQKAQEMAMARRARATTNHAIDPTILCEALFYLTEYQWSPMQISGYMALRGKYISHECIYQHVRNTPGLVKHLRHKLKYSRRTKVDRATKAKNIPGRVSISQRPEQADGSRFGDWEMDTIIGKDGKGAILTLTERSTNFLMACKLKHGKNAEQCAKEVVRKLFPYKAKTLTITTDNGSEFASHQTVTRKLGATVYFADSYCSWQKGAIENANKLLRQYIPKGTDFSKVSARFLADKVKLINKRPRKKLAFSTPLVEFFKHFH